MKKVSKLLSILLALVIFVSPMGGFFSIKAEAASSWVSSWATSMVDSAITLASLNLQDLIPARSTIRIELKVTTGGEKLRLKFSNEYGAAPITISEATVAKTVGSGKADIDEKTAMGLTFNKGSRSVSIPAGQTIWSDPVDFKTEALDALSVSLYFENTTYITSAGLSNARTYLGLRSIFREDVSQCYAADIYSSREITIGSGTITYHTTPFLAEIDTLVPAGSTDVAVFIGDSTLVNDTYYYFAEKLVKAGYKNISVVNEAVIGNKLLSDGTGVIGNLYGDALIDRFERDALNISGVKYIFVKIGLNDILHQFSKSMGDSVPHYSAKAIINGYKTLVERAHAKGIKIFFFTKSPWKGYEREFLGQTGDVVWNKEMQDMCDSLDRWIKTNDMADGYIDCSPLANPADEYALCPSFTPDGAHLTPIASVALADLIPVSFVGVDKKIRSSALLHNVDPYKEKKQIIYDLEHPTEKETEPAPEESTTKKPQENTTRPPEATTNREESTTAQNSGSASTTVPSVESTTFPQYIPPENVTVPVISKPQGGNTGAQITPDYNISDTVPETIGNGAPIAFILVLFTVVIVAGAVVFLTLTRKNEEEFE